MGWNGPYVFTPKGELFDGWGKPFRGKHEGGDDNGRLLSVVSYGADGEADGSGSDDWAATDLEFPLDTPFADLTVTLLAPDEATGSFSPPLGTADVTDTWGDGNEEKDLGGMIFECGAIFRVDRCEFGASSSVDSSVYEAPCAYTAEWAVDTAGIEPNPPDFVANSRYRFGDRVCKADGTDSPYTCVRIFPRTSAKDAKPSESYWGKGLVRDNNIFWKRVGGSKYMNRLRVAVFVPNTTTAEVDALIARNEYNDDEEKWVGWTGVAPAAVEDGGNNSVTFENLMPGHRKLYAYGYYEYDDDASVTKAANSFGSGVLDLDLKPGSNHVTVYLSERLK